ncbi:hypothetical protein HUO13_22830 [Saccharopolyspora erythraea]|uniref:4'-phosphopantetheinyl transferase family protein n=1 Tax=Saccharopolyspora erythraea TaxID=1836 RepID=UPI001BA8F1E8|nr:hypothetical protein [Saccharopolyspora erythraea]QUH03287.1 hypothetical protein HUO13_22830 [Saccharopolyspora erythraea]
MRAPVSLNLIDLDRAPVPAGRATAHETGGPVPARRSLAARDALLDVLSGVLGRRPDEAAVRPGTPCDGVYFSEARRDERYLVGTSAWYPLGVECKSAVPGCPPPLVERMLPAGERREVARLPAAARPLAFALCWCRMVAAVKACGATLDDAAHCMAATSQWAAVVAPGLVAGAAVLTEHGIDVRWRTTAWEKDAS